MNKVKTFLDVAGVEGTPEDIKLYKKLFAEETSEFIHAWADGNKVEMMDGICDMNFIGMALFELGEDVKALGETINEYIHITPFNLDEAESCFEIVCDSNLSKFDKTEAEAHETIFYYFKQFNVKCKFEFNQEHNLYCVKSAQDQEGTDGKFYPKGKLLKSKKQYFASDFSEVIGEAY